MYSAYHAQRLTTTERHFIRASVGDGERWATTMTGMGGNSGAATRNHTPAGYNLPILPAAVPMFLVALSSIDVVFVYLRRYNAELNGRGDMTA